MFFAWFAVLAKYLFQTIVLSKLYSNCLRSFMFSWVDKVITGTWAWYHLFEMLDFDYVPFQQL